MAVQVELLSALADGQCHHPDELAAALGIEVDALYAGVEQLREAGIDVDTLTSVGYCLTTPFERLELKSIRDALPANSVARALQMTVLTQVDSTNAWLAQRAATAASGTACVAEQQLAGRGRRARPWHSPFGRNIYLSMLWHMPTRGLSGLSLAVGVCVAEACEAMGAGPIALKWPNDLVAVRSAGRAKLGGILIDVSGGTDERSAVVVGIGLNVDMPDSLRAKIDQPVCDFNELAEQRVSRNRLVAQLVEGLVNMLPVFEREGLAPFRDRFAARDINRDREVDIEQAGVVSNGRARGIDDSGALMVETRHGMTRIYSGEVSLRAAT